MLTDIRSAFTLIVDSLPNKDIKMAPKYIFAYQLQKGNIREQKQRQKPTTKTGNKANGLTGNKSNALT